MLGCHSEGENAPGLEWAEARDAAEHPTVHEKEQPGSQCQWAKLRSPGPQEAGWSTTADAPDCVRPRTTSSSNSFAPATRRRLPNKYSYDKS